MVVLAQLDKFFVDNNYLLDIYMRKADALFDAEFVSSDEKIEKFKEAKKIYEEIIGKFPKSERARPLYFKAADCSLKLGLEDQAIELYQGVITNFPNTIDVPRAYFEMASTYIDLDKFEEARRIYLKVIKQFSSTEYAGRSYFKLAESYQLEADKIKEEYSIQ